MPTYLPTHTLFLMLAILHQLRSIHAVEKVDVGRLLHFLYVTRFDDLLVVK